VEVKLIEILSLKSEDGKRLNPHALKRFNDWQESILRKAPELGQLSLEQTQAYLRTYLDNDQLAELSRCLADTTEWLSSCMDTGDRYFPEAYATWVITPMSRIESLIVKAYQRFEAEQRKKAYDNRWRIVFLSMKPPVDDAKKYLTDTQETEFRLAMGRLIDAHLQQMPAHAIDLRRSDYAWWLKKIQDRKNEEAQRLQAICAADDYNQGLNQEIAYLISRLDPEEKDLPRYFRAKIRDKRCSDHNFDYVLSRRDETSLDHTLVTVANKRLEQLCPENLRPLIVFPSRYYRLYYPSPSASYSSEDTPSLDFSFDIFAVACAEVWLKSATKNFNGYDFDLPWVQEDNGLVLLEKPKFLAYHHLILRPEDFVGRVFWKSIPLVLLKGILNGETRPEGCTISAASDCATTYRVRGLDKGIQVPDRFAGYMRKIGTIDQMVAMGIVTKKVGNVIKAELDELEVKRGAPPSQEKGRRRDSLKETAFRLFDEGKRPGDADVKALGMKPNTAYRYYQEWKKTRNRI
jgi:hypothetical protein